MSVQHPKTWTGKIGPHTWTIRKLPPTVAFGLIATVKNALGETVIQALREDTTTQIGRLDVAGFAKLAATSKASPALRALLVRAVTPSYIEPAEFEALGRGLFVGRVTVDTGERQWEITQWSHFDAIDIDVNGMLCALIPALLLNYLPSFAGSDTSADSANAA